MASGAKLSSCAGALDSAEKSFELITARYENGKASITEFNESKNNVMKAQSDLAQARFENLFQIKLLDFYAGAEISL